MLQKFKQRSDDGTSHSRRSFEWALRTRALTLGPRTLIMGILNVTPDSFSDGGRYVSPGAAVEAALRMLDEGADVVDVGGESTRPGATPLSASEECARVLPVIEGILRSRADAVLSIDTYHAATARIAVDAGAEIVNDVSGNLWDSAMAATCGELRSGLVIMHTRGRPSEWKTQQPLAEAEVLPLVCRGLKTQAEAGMAAGVARGRIVLDPGFGFGKIGDENLPLLNGFSRLATLGFPLLAGLSRKSFLRGRAAVGKDARRGILPATLAANTAAIFGGAHILRVHDVAEARAAADLVDRLMRLG